VVLAHHVVRVPLADPRRYVAWTGGVMNRSQFLGRLDRAWQDFLSACDGLSEAELLAGGVTGNWSVRDLIAHVNIWEEETLHHLPTIKAGGRTPKYSDQYGGIDAFNAQAMAERRDLPLAEVLRRRDETHRRLLDYLQEQPEELFAQENRFRRRLRYDTYSHYPEHTRAIRAWREQRSIV
jgi:hypothetical protein